MDCLFKVVDRESEMIVLVYSVRDDITGFPHFLIYEDKKWEYRSAKYFKPIGER